jgi:hypothetical protein
VFFLEDTRVLKGVCLFVCFGLRTRPPRDALRTNEAKRQASSQRARVLQAIEMLVEIKQSSKLLIDQHTKL